MGDVLVQLNLEVKELKKTVNNLESRLQDMERDNQFQEFVALMAISLTGLGFIWRVYR